MDEKIKILFLAANPVDAIFRLRIEKELREIGKKIWNGIHRDRFEMAMEMALRPSDLAEALQRHKPHIVHFSGHGTKEDGIVLENEEGRARLVDKAALVRIFEILKDNIRLVVLNACYAKDQAEALAKTIDYAIGTNDTIGDEAAVAFAANLYQALANGRSVEEAFALALAELDLEQLGWSNSPVLLVRPGADPTRPLFEAGVPTRDEGGRSRAGSGSSRKGGISLKKTKVHGDVTLVVGDNTKFIDRVEIDVK